MSDRDLVVRAEDEAVVARHVACDAELRLHIVLHLMVVPVQVVRRDVGDDGDICLEVVYIVKLEAAELEDIDVVLLRSYLVGIALSDVSAESDVQSGLLEKMIDKRCRCRLSVASCDADLLCRVIASCKFDLRNHIDALLHHLLHHRGCGRDAGTLDDLVCVEDEILGMSALLVRYLPLVEHGCVILGNLTHIREEHIITFNLCEDCGAYSAFASA